MITFYRGLSSLVVGVMDAREWFTRGAAIGSPPV